MTEITSREIRDINGQCKNINICHKPHKNYSSWWVLKSRNLSFMNLKIKIENHHRELSNNSANVSEEVN